MLCQLLTAAGAAGNPHSYFREEDTAEWAEAWDVSLEALPGSDAPSRAFLNAAISQARGNTPVFGLRLMHESLPGLLTYLRALSLDGASDRDCLEAVFGPLTFIHLYRDDTVDQAISLLRAEQSGLWHKGQDGSEIERLEPVAAPGYDFDRLHAHVSALDAEKAAWPDWFRAQDITPLSLSYDELVDDPFGTIVMICKAIGVAQLARESIKVSTAKLSDATSAEWKTRYTKDRLGTP